MRLVIWATCLLAVATCAATVLIAGRADIAVIGSVALLALAIVAGHLPPAATPPRAEAETATALREQAGELARLRKRLTAIEARAGDERADPDELRRLAARIEALETAAAPSRRPAAGPGSVAPERLHLYLEPVVSRAAGRTVHYRASLAVEQADGAHLPLAAMAGAVARDGATAALDLETFRRAGDVIRRIHAKGGDAGVFCPLSGAAIGDRDCIERLVTFIGASPDVARSLIIDVSQDALAGLSVEGTEGLAYLAELGAIFSLSGAAIEGNDVAALANLGFAYIDVDIGRLSGAAMPGPGGALPPAAALLERCVRERVTPIVSGVAAQLQLDRLGGAVDLARGPLFAPPRLVRAMPSGPLRAARVA